MNPGSPPTTAANTALGGDAKAHTDRYSAGIQAMAWVNPEDPVEAVLEPWLSTILIVALFFAGLLWGAFRASPHWLPVIRRSRG